MDCDSVWTLLEVTKLGQLFTVPGKGLFPLATGRWARKFAQLTRIGEQVLRDRLGKRFHYKERPGMFA